jgi:hypothetical protein
LVQLRNLLLTVNINGMGILTIASSVLWHQWFLINIELQFESQLHSHTAVKKWHIILFSVIRQSIDMNWLAASEIDPQNQYQFEAHICMVH